MVTPTRTDRVNERRNKKLQRIAQKEKLYRTSIKSEARLAAQHASQRTYRVDDSSFAGSEASFVSTERAIQRGSRRALQDSFGSDSVAHSSSGADYDWTAATEDVTTHHTGDSTSSHHSKKNKMFLVRVSRTEKPKPKKKKSRERAESHESALSAAITQREAWMCGCCGKVFTTYKSAELHEERCMREKVMKFGLAQEKEEKKPITSSAYLPPKLKTAERQLSTSGSFTSAHSDMVSPTTSKTVNFTSINQGRSLQTLDEYDAVPGKSILRNSNETPPPNKLDRRALFAQSSPLEDSDEIPEWKAVEDDLLLTGAMRKYVALPDEALVDVVLRALPMALTPSESQAERELMLLAGDKAYYDEMQVRAALRDSGRLARAQGSGIMAKVQNKFVDAYHLIKDFDPEGDMAGGNQRKKKGAGSAAGPIQHSDSTMYINVIVKQSIRVVNNELERMAKRRWEELNTGATHQDKVKFDRFRKFAQVNAVKLAGLALASDFTPRKIAVQLSHDLYRLMTPQLRRRGVTIETETEYRVGPYFILAVNIKTIDWVKLMKYANKDRLIQLQKWKRDQERRDQLNEKEEGDNQEEELTKWKRLVQRVQKIRQVTLLDIMARALAWLHKLPWIISVPICSIMYHLFLRVSTRKYILATATDAVFSYVEEKGMEMEIQVKQARFQAAFMLGALREIKEDSRELKKKQQETESAEKGPVIGPLLGPAIKADKGPAVEPPGFEMPENLEFVGLEVDLHVGFRRLRWAFLSAQSRFVEDAWFAAEADIKDIEFQDWSHHHDHIGAPDLPADVNPEDFVGAERETQFLMPKSAFVSAMVAYETNIITCYNDYCFCVKKRTLTPDAPFGGSFVAWTQYVITNTGNDTCRMVCSVEAEFPNGEPMVARQIRSGMRAGTGETFVMCGETICKYADEYP